MKSESGTKGNGSKISIKIPCKNGKKNQEERCERGAGENKEKKKLSFEVSLSQLEIEEDIFGFTGLRPNRRPKKRAKNVQKQLDVRKVSDLNFFSSLFIELCNLLNLI